MANSTPDPLNCPLCGGPAAPAFAVGDYPLADCLACPHRFAAWRPPAEHAATVYGDEYFTGGGAGYSDYLAEARLLRNRGAWYARKIRPHAAAGTMLDIGAAAGFVLEGFQSAGWRGRGLEPNARMAALGRERGIDIQPGTLETLPHRGEPVDLVSMIQVAAHFADVPAAFRAAAAATKPGGLWLFETWNYRSWTARAFGKGWHEYSPPSVLHWWCPEGLAKFAGTFGFRKVAGGRPAKWLDGAHAKSLVRHGLGGGWAGKIAAPALWLVPDRLPIPYPAEDLFWLLLQKDG